MNRKEFKELTEAIKEELAAGNEKADTWLDPVLQTIVHSKYTPLYVAGFGLGAFLLGFWLG